MTTATARARLAALILPLVLLPAAGCDLAMADLRQKDTADWRKTWDLQPGGRLEIANVNGRIDVQPSSGAQVEVVARKTATGASTEAAREALGRIEIQETAGGGGVRLETRVSKGAGGPFSRTNQQVDYTVKVPADTPVVLRTVNGGITVAGLAGRVEAETTNGGVKARDISGAIAAVTTNGGLDIEVSRLAEGGVRLECTNGGIELRLPSDAKATISAHVTNGGVSTDGLSVDPSGPASRRRLEGRLNGGGAPVELRGTNGGIRISSR